MTIEEYRMLIEASSLKELKKLRVNAEKSSDKRANKIMQMINERLDDGE